MSVQLNCQVSCHGKKKKKRRWLSARLNFAQVDMNVTGFSERSLQSTRLIKFASSFSFKSTPQTIMFSVFRRTAVEVAESSLKGTETELR